MSTLLLGLWLSGLLLPGPPVVGMPAMAMPAGPAACLVLPLASPRPFETHRDLQAYLPLETSCSSPSGGLGSQRLADAISQDLIASPQWRSVKQQLAGKRRQLLAVPPAGRPLPVD